ncbi:MAG: sigma-70 family RNA polymerase sigma factor [Myxococcota bacterium]
MTTRTDDMILLERWRAGDREAGDTLIRRHYGYAYRLARRRLGNDDAAVEATQHAMMVVVHKRDEIDVNFRAYLAKVVYFSVLSQSKRHEHQPLTEDVAGADPPRGPSTLMAHREQEKLIVKALRSMSIDDQLVFYYDFVSDKTRGELAELLGVSPKGIYKRVTRARHRLETLLQSFRDAPARPSTLGGLETWLRSLHAKAARPRHP